MAKLDFKQKIRNIPDWPVKGVNFKDITPLLSDPEYFRSAINALSKPYYRLPVDKVVAIDARGFLLATPIAYKLKAGVCLVRKKGKLPWKTIEEVYQKEYGPDVLAIHQDAIKKGDRVVIVDDVLATGETMVTTIKLVEKLQGEVVGIGVVVDLTYLRGRRKLSGYQYYWLVNYEDE